MGPPFLLVDGYNLLHAAGLARVRYAPGDLERQRQKLLGRLLDKLLPPERSRTTVIFDANDPPPDRPRQYRHQDLSILFAAVGRDADTEIELLLNQHSAPRRTIVVSSDHRLHRAAQRRGAHAVDSEKFLDDLSRRPPAWEQLAAQQLASAPKPQWPAPSDVDRWLNEFSDVSVADIQAEVDAEELSHSDLVGWDAYVIELQSALRDPAQLAEWINQPAKEGRQRSND